MNKQNRNRVTNTEDKQVVARGEEGQRMNEIGEGNQQVQTSSYKINESWG